MEGFDRSLDCTHQLRLCAQNPTELVADPPGSTPVGWFQNPPSSCSELKIFRKSLLCIGSVLEARGKDTYFMLYPISMERCVMVTDAASNPLRVV